MKENAAGWLPRYQLEEDRREHSGGPKNFPCAALSADHTGHKHVKIHKAGHLRLVHWPCVSYSFC